MFTGHASSASCASPVQRPPTAAPGDFTVRLGEEIDMDAGWNYSSRNQYVNEKGLRIDELQM